MLIGEVLESGDDGVGNQILVDEFVLEDFLLQKEHHVPLVL